MIPRLGTRTEQPARFPGSAADAPSPPSSPIRGRFVAGLAALAFLTVFASLAAIGIAIALLPGWIGVAITSGSMEPGIRTGDFVLVNDAPSLIRDGQVITFEDPVSGALVTHRIIETLDDGRVITKGDANPVADPIPVERSAVIGAARFVVPFIGYPAYWILTMQFLWLALAAAVTVCAVALARHAWPSEVETDPDIVVDLR